MSTEGLNIYRVGGAVRDTLLGLPFSETDWVVVGSTEAEMLKRGFRRVGKDFPVFLHPKTQEEYALARTERKQGRGYYGFVCHASPDVTLEEDLLRRDLTINAMAEDLQGNLIDPYHGAEDLKNRILRHVSPAFSEDPVRILRVARMAAKLAFLGFQVAPETLTLMQGMVKQGEINELVPERVWQEMVRALQLDDPAQFILVLRESHALAVLWPSLDKLWGVPQTAEYHPEIDTGVHIMMALQIAAKLTPDPVTRFAVLCHDLGKGLTPASEWPSHHGHEESGVPLIQDFCDRYRVPKEYRELAIAVSRFHLHCHKAYELKPSTVLKTLERLDAFRNPERFEKFLIACLADARGRLGLENREYPQADLMRKALTAANTVEVAPLLAAGFEGLALADELRKRRITAIAGVGSGH